MWRAFVDAALGALLAPVCAICGAVLDRPLDGAVCPDCWMRVVRFTPPVCRNCGSPLPSVRASDAHHGRCRRCAVELRHIACARAVGPFEGTMIDVVHALKYARRRSVAGPLAHLVRRASVDALEDVDVVVPVPLHPARERERGFNQAEELARGLGPPVCRALLRIAATVPQVTLSGRARRNNLREAFALAPESRLVRGCTVALVDDVLTTGATLSACAAALVDAHPLRIVAVTAARAETGPHA